MSNVHVPIIYKQEIEAIVEAGYYHNKSEVMEDALRTLFEAKTELRLTAAVELYKKGRVTLSKAAGIGGVNILEFRDILASRGIRIRVPAESKKDIKRGVERLKRLRSVQ